VFDALVILTYLKYANTKSFCTHRAGRAAMVRILVAIALVIPVVASGGSPASAALIFTNRTTANGLGNNAVLSVAVVGSTAYAGTGGVVLIASAAGALSYGVAGTSAVDWANARTVVLLVSGLAALTLFVAHQRRTDAPTHRRSISSSSPPGTSDGATWRC